MGFLSNIANNIESDFNKTFSSLKGAVNNFIKPGKATFGGEVRAILRVPSEYISTDEVTLAANGTLDNLDRIREVNGEQPTGTKRYPTAPSSVLQGFGGIIFPYTPTIDVDNKAEYAPQTPLHSNFTQYFYKNSSVGPIRVSGKFTVQDQDEGAMLLGTLHLLRSLTKMRFGDDPYAGAPPPVCRFDAYGSMFDNVPVVVSSWKHELPADVDYITVNLGDSPALVPVVSTISIDLNIVYSRQEMLDYNVPSWINNTLKGRGFI